MMGPAKRQGKPSLQRHKVENKGCLRIATHKHPHITGFIMRALSASADKVRRAAAVGRICVLARAGEVLDDDLRGL